MTKIKILPENIANKIAAGEVVQRPESVVKELMENALDAGATIIEVVVKHAGKSLIQVIDDGQGMEEEDAMISVQRHATSKVYSYEDLERIHTYGFRGEALAAISSVSQFEIRTQTANNEIGTLIKTDDGVEIVCEKGFFPTGTSVSVKNLFFNTPARRNFMKSDATELKHIIETFKRAALSSPHIAFKFFNDDDLIFDYPVSSLEDRVKMVIADNILDTVIEVKEITDYISLHGYIAKPNFLKKAKGEQYLFINERFVVNRQINHAVFNAYENMLERGDYPFFVLFLNIDPRHVDINIHPQKLEVKFDDDRDIYSFVYAVIKKGISSHDLIPNMAFNPFNGQKETLSFNNMSGRTEKNDFSDRPNNGYQNYRQQPFSDQAIDMLFGGLNGDLRRNAPEHQVPHPFDGAEDKRIYQINSKAVSDKTQGEESSFIIQLHNKYILSQIRSGLMIIDQHVAHERILYEKVFNSFMNNMPFSQQLLFSQTVTVDPGDYALIKELNPYLSKMGFEIKLFGKNTIVIDGVPQDVKVGSEEQILLEIIDEYKKNQREKHLEERDNLAKSYSCKAAIKSGDKLTEAEMRQMVDQLFATSTPYVCPHGRPIVIKIPLEEFDKRFGRTS